MISGKNFTGVSAGEYSCRIYCAEEKIYCIKTYNKPDLMYVGMSRARNMLYVFETKHAKNYRSKLW